MRRPLDVPPKREIGFVSFVRASGRGEAACLREKDYLSLRWPLNSRIILRFVSFSIFAFEGFYQFLFLTQKYSLTAIHP